jgi:hypothetical protein
MRILSWSVGEILEEVTHFENQQKEIKSEIMKMCWYMRGSITLDEGFSLSFEDRELINDIIKQNLETTKKSGLPFF